MSQMAETRSKLATSPHVEGMFTSPTGSGIKALFRVPNYPDKHEMAFEALTRYCLELTGLTIDPSGKDVARLCFVSHDEESFYNEKATELVLEHYTQTLRHPDSTTLKTPTTLKTLTTPMKYNECGVFTKAESNETSWYESWLHEYIPDTPSQTNKLQFEMCGRLIDLEKTSGRKRTPKELRQLNKAWYEKTPKACLSESEETYLKELPRRLSHRKMGTSENPVNAAWTRIQSQPTPLEISALDLPEHLNKLATLCFEIQKAMPNKSWSLSTRQVGQLLQLTPGAANNQLRQLEGFGTIKCIKRGDAKPGGLATEYSFMISATASTNAT